MGVIKNTVDSSIGWIDDDLNHKPKKENHQSKLKCDECKYYYYKEGQHTWKAWSGDRGHNCNECDFLEEHDYLYEKISLGDVS
jgi:hypothetical protein